MRAGLLLLPLAGGCNALFGLDPAQVGDDVPGDGGVGDDSGPRPDAPSAELATVFGASLDYTQAGSTVSGRRDRRTSRKWTSNPRSASRWQDRTYQPPWLRMP